jgi:hypothetical protein
MVSNKRTSPVDGAGAVGREERGEEDGVGAGEG